MSDELLPYYDRELRFLRHLGAEFRAAHPKIAGRLLLGDEETGDPHVERLVEAFAFLNARIRHKLDDDFPEISDAMLGVLYPHYQAPIPPMAVIQFVLDRGQGDLTTGYTIPRGETIEAEAAEGDPCRFRTSYPVTIYPIELVSVALRGKPFSAPASAWTSEAAAVLRLELKCYSKDMTFAQLQIGSLRLFLMGQHAYDLYELLFDNALGIAVANSPKDPAPVFLDKKRLRQVGFERDEGVLPYAARSFLGYRLLTEYFAFPQKYLFVDLGPLDKRTLAGAGNRLEIYVYLNRTSVDLEQNTSEASLRLGCTPMVNLYRQRAEPIALTHTETEYRVVADARRPQDKEIYSIDRVTATSPDNEQIDYQPFYSFKHAADRQRQKAFWHAVRRPAGQPEGKSAANTDLYLALVDLGFSPSAPARWTLDVQTTCLDGDRASRLPWGEGQPTLRLAGGAPLARIECLTRLTPTLRPALKLGALWRLISHLSLNHLSLADYEEGADALREILKLYDFADSDQTRNLIDGILSVRTRRVVGRVPGEPRGGFCRGLEVTIQFDEERFAGSGWFLFACVLERFLGLYCSINSFSRLIATAKKREGELRRWPPRAGEMVLL